jgi:hypothetical protein
MILDCSYALTSLARASVHRRTCAALGPPHVSAQPSSAESAQVAAAPDEPHNKLARGLTLADTSPGTR